MKSEVFMSDDKNVKTGSATSVLEKTKEKTKEPKLFNVVFHNDDYTTMEFVMFVLQEVFHKSAEEAVSLMLSVHNSGKGIAGTFVKEIAEMKKRKVVELAIEQDAPLVVTVEEK